MEHLSFNIICSIADGDMPQNEIELHLTHLASCPACQQEVELQRSIVRVSRQIRLVKPSTNFTQGILDVIIPSQKKRWYEWLLHNMGNVIAMALVLAFLVYIFSITDTGAFKNDNPTKIKPVIEFVKIIQMGSQQLGNYLTPKLSIQSSGTSHTHTIVFAFLAIVLLVFIDRIADHFFRRMKANL
jgi:hypothetical protein